FCDEVFLLCFAATVLTFFIAGLLYLLCFKHVDNLGAYSIPFGDRPSHPICFQLLSRGTILVALVSVVQETLLGAFSLTCSQLSKVRLVAIIILVALTGFF